MVIGARAEGVGWRVTRFPCHDGVRTMAFLCRRLFFPGGFSFDLAWGFRKRFRFGHAEVKRRRVVDGL